MPCHSEFDFEFRVTLFVRLSCLWLSWLVIHPAVASTSMKAPVLRESLCAELLQSDSSLSAYDFMFSHPGIQQEVRTIANRFEALSSSDVGRLQILRLSENEVHDAETAENRKRYFKELLWRLRPRLTSTSLPYLDLMIAEQTEPQGDWIFYQAQWALSDYLAANGIRHYVLREGKKLHIYISAYGSNPLNVKAKRLNQYGTKLKIELGAIEVYNRATNTMSLAGMRLASEANLWSETTDLTVKEVSQSPIREIILNSDNRSELEFLLDPEAILPGHLMHVAVMSPPLSEGHTNFRISYRTGLVDNALPVEVQQSMRAAAKMSAQGSRAMFMGLRKPDGSWILTVPTTAQRLEEDPRLASDDEPLEDAIPDLNQEGSAGHDYFMFFSSERKVLDPTLRNNLAGLAERWVGRALDTVNLVHVGIKGNGQVFYHISSRQPGTAASMTHIKDFLKEPLRSR